MRTFFSMAAAKPLVQDLLRSYYLLFPELPVAPVHAGVTVARNRHRELLVEAKVCVHRDRAAPRAMEYMAGASGDQSRFLNRRLPSVPEIFNGLAAAREYVFGLRIGGAESLKHFLYPPDHRDDPWIVVFTFARQQVNQPGVKVNMAPLAAEDFGSPHSAELRHTST
jgi:hypothetical protein